MKNKKPDDAPLDPSTWTLVPSTDDTPAQENGSDCGVFTIRHCEFLSRRAALGFTQANMPYFRKRTIHELLSGELMAYR